MKEEQNSMDIPGPISYLSHSNKINTSSLMQNIWEFDHDPNNEILMNMLHNKIRKKHSYEPIKQVYEAGYKNKAIINKSKDIDMLAEYHSMIEESSNKINSQYQYNNLAYKNIESRRIKTNGEEDMILKGLEGEGHKYNGNSNNKITNYIKQNQRVHNDIQQISHLEIGTDNKESNINVQQAMQADNYGIHKYREHEISSVKTVLIKPQSKAIQNVANNAQLCNNYYRNEDILWNKQVSNNNYMQTQLKQLMQLVRAMHIQMEVEECRKAVMKYQIECRRLRISLRTCLVGSAPKMSNTDNKDDNDREDNKQVQVHNQYNIDPRKYMRNAAIKNTQNKQISSKQLVANNNSNNINSLNIPSYPRRQDNSSKQKSPRQKQKPKLTYNRMHRHHLRPSRSAHNIMKQMRQLNGSDMIKIYSKVSNEYNSKQKQQWLFQQIMQQKQRQQKLRTKQILINNYYESLCKKQGHRNKNSNILNVNSNESMHKQIVQQIQTEQTIMGGDGHLQKQIKKYQIMGNKVDRNEPQYREVLANKRNVIVEILQQSNRHYGYKMNKLQEENIIIRNQINIIDTKLREVAIQCSKVRSNKGVGRTRNNNSKNQMEKWDNNNTNYNNSNNNNNNIRVSNNSNNNRYDNQEREGNKDGAMRSSDKRKRYLVRSPAYAHQYGYAQPALKKHAQLKQTYNATPVTQPKLKILGLRRTQSHQQIQTINNNNNNNNSNSKGNKEVHNMWGMDEHIGQSKQGNEVSLELMEQEQQQYNIEYGGHHQYNNNNGQPYGAAVFDALDDL